MKRIIILFTFLFLLSTILFSSDFAVYIGRKRVIISMPTGWRALRAARGSVFRAVSGNDTFTIRVLKMDSNSDKVFKTEEYILKRYAHKTFEIGSVSIEGFKLHNYVLSHVKGDIEIFSRTLMTKSNNALIVFKYTSIEKKRFFRNLYEVDLIISKFFRNNIYS